MHIFATIILNRLMMKKQILAIILSLFSLAFISYGQGSNYSGSYKTSAPIIWNGVSGQTISGIDIENAPGNSIDLTNCSNIIIKNFKIANSKGIGIKLYSCTNITITNCYIDFVSTGVYACMSTGIKFEYNEVRNVTGPMPRGQMIQFDEVNGRGNSISYNIGENIQGQSAPEDEISIYKSNGLPNYPIVIAGNWIRGGGPSNSGGGIMTGDGGGSYVLVKDNILINPGQYGIAISSGNNITVQNNKVYSAQLPFSNVGIYAFNQYPSSCSTNTVTNNTINFTYKTGILNNTYTDGTCGTITGWTSNVYDPNLNSSILPQKIIGRTKGITKDFTSPKQIQKKKINLFKTR
jgi:parallel beta-helix repeat protein